MNPPTIRKQAVLKAPRGRVWRALTNHEEFGTWFHVKLDGPFVAGQRSTGHITYPGYEHIRWDAVIVAIEPERRFVYTWHPAPLDAGTDYSKETPTTVEFTLEDAPEGTRLTVTESGFDQIPARRQLDAFRMNDEGWTSQIENIEEYVAPRQTPRR